MTFRTITISISALVVATAASAAEPRRTSELRAANETLARRADQTKGAPRQLLLLEQQRVERAEHGLP